MARMPRKAGRLIREWREAQQPKPTQDDLGKEVGVSGTYVRKLENGQLACPMPLAVKLSQRTGISISDLLTREQRRLLRSALALKEGDPAANPPGSRGGSDAARPEASAT